VWRTEKINRTSTARVRKKRKGKRDESSRLNALYRGATDSFDEGNGFGAPTFERRPAYAIARNKGAWLYRVGGAYHRDQSR